MFRKLHPSIATRTFILALLALAFASSASASPCLSQGETVFQSCLENLAADGSIHPWEEGICGRAAADIVTACELPNKPDFEPFVSCTRSWSFTIFWDHYQGEFTVLLIFSGPLICT